MEHFDIALFIIPAAVSFPGATVPLHVFEPRYRNLIKESSRLGRRVAVCHAKKKIGQAKSHQTRAEILNSNQDTYEPQSIFGAGPVEIVDVTADGRLAVEIHVDGRYRVLEEIQSVPYRIARCEKYGDDVTQLNRQDLLQRRNEIDAALLKISQNAGDQLDKILTSRQWTQLPIEDYSFKIFQYIRFEPVIMQQILEMQNPLQRLDLLATALGARD